MEHVIKIDKDVNRRDILQGVVLLWTQHHSDDVEWTFQQYFAPAQRVKTAQEWCFVHFPDFIKSAEWLSNSLDHNPMDYSVCSILEGMACAKPQEGFKSLNQSFSRERNIIPLEEPQPIAEKVKKLLKLSIAANDGHPETS